MNKLLNADSKTYDEIVDVCRKHNISISELCRRAGIDRQKMNLWKQSDPKSIVALKAINVELEKIENQSVDSVTEGVTTPKRFCKKQDSECKFECGDQPCKLTT